MTQQLLGEKLCQIQQSIQTYYPSCTLVVVTKNYDLAVTKAVLQAEIKHIGESKVQDAIKKKKLLGNSSFTYHMIGHLQTNKAKQAVELFDMIQSVDSLKLARELNKHAKESEKKLPILLQVKLTMEAQKYGFFLKEIPEVIEIIEKYRYLDLQGLMTIGKQGDKETTKMAFRRLRHLCNVYQYPICSMGMSDDREIALEEGSTMLRIGSFLLS